MRAIIAELQLALMLLTRLPAGHLSHVPSMGQSAWAFPVVGMIVGAIAAGVITGLTAALPMMDPMLAAGVTVAVMVLITGGLHEDGLADLADGFGGGRDKARKLEIMRDSRIGSYGTLALILVLGLKVQAIGQGAAVWGLIAIEAASRAGLPLVLRLLPSARSDGLGHGAAQVSWGRVAVALALGLAALTLLGGMAAVTIAVTIALVVAAISVLALRQIGGQTGDVLGAMQALSACAAWIVFSATH